ncbi:MAG: hypothetical protein DMF87_16805 [Acidobacteria bacterium]|nr:MAG: hypothetical protein DMF87_16805 [Acidobacteriota bacterium]
MRVIAPARWVVVVLLLLMWRAPAARAQVANAERIDPAVLTAFARAGEASYLVLLREAADVSAATAMTDRLERGRFVYSRLQQVAESSQASIRTFLRAEQQAGRVRQMRPYFIINAIAVRSTRSVALALAAFPEVDRIIVPPEATIPAPQPASDAATPQAIEWNLTQIGAPTLWANGIKGQGIVVANIDTGVQFDHPALVTQYRGNLGGGVFDHNYNWWDASGPLGGPGALVPIDDQGHGTHTMGTMVGNDGGANQIGVAPSARWMACKACSTLSCSFIGLLECGQFVLAPWNLAEQNPNPDLRPHVVNNSWGFAFGGIGLYRTVVQNWRAAGIFPAFSAGNAGPGCNTTASPGDYPEAFATGATDRSDAIADFSSRGPSAFSGIVKPDASAPGVAVRSSVPTNSYATFSGTSMASPHTAGLVALLWSFYPGLVRDVDNTEKKLRPAASILNTSQACGGNGPTTHPNNVFGWGRHDAVPGIALINIYADKSVYSTGEIASIRVSLVSPLTTGWSLDLHLGVIFPGGSTLSTTPITIAPLTEVFDIPVGNFTWSTEPAGEYTWFVILTEHGADVNDPATHLSGDVARVTKN